jgi:hypothetical protein
MVILLTALSGLVWGLLAHELEVAHAVRLAIPVGLCVGMVMGFLIRPLRDVEWPATAALSLIGLYVAVALFAALYSTVDLVASGQRLVTWPSVIAESMWTFTWGLSLSGYVFLLWPLSFANHALVWWYQRRSEVIPV